MTVDISQDENDMVVEDLENLSFDDWKELFEQSPERFDVYRKRMLEHQITLAPEDSKQRLRGLMFQMECESAKSQTPLNYNLRLYAMMMEQFTELREKLQLLCSGDANSFAQKLTDKQSATVLPFNQRTKPLQTEI